MKWTHSTLVGFLGLLLLLLPGYLPGLSLEEKEILPSLSKDVLISIILVQNEGLEALELTIKSLDESLTKLKIQQEEEAKLLKIQTELFQRSLLLQKELARKNLIDKITIGAVTFIGGGLIGYSLN